jgi:hypothetical protein
MDVIVHRIALRAGVTTEEFEAWVRTVDYASCPQLHSVLQFSVQRVDAAGIYFELIAVRSRAEFERDMSTPAFGRLVDGFSALATVVGEIAGSRIEPGYLAAAASTPVGYGPVADADVDPEV